MVRTSELTDHRYLYIKVHCQLLTYTYTMNSSSYEYVLFNLNKPKHPICHFDFASRQNNILQHSQRKYTKSNIHQIHTIGYRIFFLIITYFHVTHQKMTDLTNKMFGFFSVICNTSSKATHFLYNVYRIAQPPFSLNGLSPGLGNPRIRTSSSAFCSQYFLMSRTHSETLTRGIAASRRSCSATFRCC